MAAERDEKIGPTAHYTAWVWHRLKLPHAEHFATRRGAVLFYGARLAGEWVAAALPNVPSMPQYLAQRHLAIEHALHEARPDCIIELGAGLSRRGVTWAHDHGVRYVEVDLPHMVTAKRARVPRHLAENLSHASHDVLADDFGDRLRELIGDAERPVIVAEGLLGYFPRDERVKVLRAARAAFGEGRGTFVCDLRAAEGGQAIRVAATLLKLGIKAVTGGRGAREDFRDDDDVRAFFAEGGFPDAAPIDLRDVPGAPRVPTPASVWQAR